MDISITVGDLIKNLEKNGKDFCLKWLMEKSEQPVTKVSLKKKIEKIINQYKNLQKSKNKHFYAVKFENFCSQKFDFPKIQKQKKQNGVELEVNKLKTEDFEIANNVIIGLSKDFGKCCKKNAELEKEKHNLKENVKIRLATKSRLAQKVIEKKFLKKRIGYLSNQVLEKNRLIKQLRSAKTYIQRQKSGLNQKYENVKKETNLLKESIEIMKKEISDLKKNNNNLQCYCENLENNNDEKTLNMFNNSKNCFKTETQECVFDLLSMNVTSSNISPVISRVLKLVNIKPDRLPSVSTVNNMNIERLIASQKHLAEVLPHEENLCLLSDETSKFGKKVEGFHVRTEKKQYFTLGLRQIVTKSGQDTMGALHNILSDIETIGHNCDDEKRKSIILNISSTMSDRAATQVKFNDILQSYRTDILKDQMGENWDLLNDGEQKSLTSLNNFFCGLHALVHIAETASESLKIIETGHFDKEVPIYDSAFRLHESGTVRLIRTASKAFSCGGDAKSGVYGHFTTFSKDFLNENKMKSVPIQRYHGNRFNILFENASYVYFMHEKIKEYLDFDASNRLLLSVKHDVNIDFFLAGVKALGLIHYFITSPLWSFIERKDVHVIESCVFFDKICVYIENSGKDVDNFIEGKLMLEGENIHTSKSDVILNYLLSQSKYDSDVALILQSMLPAILNLMVNIFTDYIGDGKWASCSSEIKAGTKAVPMHNKYSESLFGHVDRLLREKPNISFISQEAYIMFCHNRTSNWLLDMDEKKKQEILNECRKEMKSLRIKFKERRKEIEERRKAIIKQKIREKEEKEARKVRKLEKHTEDIIEWGLWQSDLQADNNLCLCKNENDKKKALKAQLHFRQKVLHQTLNGNKDVYKLSKKVNGKSKPLTVSELLANVKALIHHALTLPSNDSDEVVLVGRNISMNFLLDDGQSQWFEGHVISKVPGYPSWFNVKFNGDRAVYTYELLKDLKNKDLIIRP